MPATESAARLARPIPHPAVARPPLASQRARLAGAFLAVVLVVVVLAAGLGSAPSVPSSGSDRAANNPRQYAAGQIAAHERLWGRGPGGGGEGLPGYAGVVTYSLADYAALASTAPTHLLAPTLPGGPDRT